MWIGREREWLTLVLKGDFCFLWFNALELTYYLFHMFLVVQGFVCPPNDMATGAQCRCCEILFVYFRETNE